jgi:simple sugar transport system ATP-binding protein
VAVARAVIWGRRVLIMDEPVAALAPQQTQNVLALMDQARRERHVSVIFVSHSIPHVFEAADRVTVLRRGRTVLTAPIGEVTTNGLIAAMTGAVEGAA